MWTCGKVSTLAQRSPCPIKLRADQLEQISNVEGLGKHSIKGITSVRTVCRTDQNQRDLSGARLSAEAPTQRAPIHDGHHEIGKDQVRLSGEGVLDADVSV